MLKRFVDIIRRRKVSVSLQFSRDAAEDGELDYKISFVQLSIKDGEIVNSQFFTVKEILKLKGFLKRFSDDYAIDVG